MTRVLVTGAAGFVGSHVVEFLVERGVDVMSLDLGDGFPSGSVDVVVSLAATAEPREALRDPVAAYTNNARIMVETLEYARKADARVLHVSTNEVYGSKDGPVYAPKGPYAGGKACQEIICQTYGVPTTIVVTQSLFGERQQKNKLVPVAIRSLLAGEPVTLQRNGTAFASRPFLHVRNLAHALYVLAVADTGQRRVHVGSDHVIPVDRMVKHLAQALDRDVLIRPIPAGDRAGHELKVEPIGCDLAGWHPQYDTIPALHEVARWYRNNPEWL